MGKPGLAALIGALTDAADNEEGTSIMPEAAIMRLREAAEKYKAGVSRFKFGDLVTPAADCNVKGAGEPFIVVAVNPFAVCDMTVPPTPSDQGSMSYGRRNDMRVLHLHGDTLVAYWVESWCFEPYPA